MPLETPLLLVRISLFPEVQCKGRIDVRFLHPPAQLEACGDDHPRIMTASVCELVNRIQCSLSQRTEIAVRVQ